MLQMVASGRGVAALPRWLVEEKAAKFDVAAVKLGRQGVSKQIHLGMRVKVLSVRNRSAVCSRPVPDGQHAKWRTGTTRQCMR